MKFRVVLLANDKYKKTLHRSKARKMSFIRYHKLKAENKVLFPKKFVNSHKIIPINYKICVTKITEDGDRFRILRDKYGKLYTEKPLGDWTILDSDDYYIEETFWIYGMNNRKLRPTIHEVLKKLLTGVNNKKNIKQIIVVHNKLLIYNEDQFDMVLCKNIEDAQRLHHTLAKIVEKQKIKNLMFAGTASSVMISRLYNLIVSKTGWKIEKVWRTTTRP